MSWGPSHSPHFTSSHGLSTVPLHHEKDEYHSVRFGESAIHYVTCCIFYLSLLHGFSQQCHILTQKLQGPGVFWSGKFFLLHASVLILVPTHFGVQHTVCSEKHHCSSGVYKTTSIIIWSFLYLHWFTCVPAVSQQKLWKTILNWGKGAGKEEALEKKKLLEWLILASDSWVKHKCNNRSQNPATWWVEDGGWMTPRAALGFTLSASATGVVWRSFQVTPFPRGHDWWEVKSSSFSW